MPSYFLTNPKRCLYILILQWSRVLGVRQLTTECLTLWHHYAGSSGVATRGAWGAECHPWQQKICQKSGKTRKNRGKKRKNREERAKIRKVLSLFPSWQTGLATLLAGSDGGSNWWPCFYESWYTDIWMWVIL